MQRLRIALIALLIGLCFTPAVFAASDAVQFGQNISVAENQNVGDAVCFFCSITVKGTLHGDAVVFFGSVKIDGETHGDVVTFFGNDTLAPDAKIAGDMVTFFGETEVGENAKVGGDAVVLFGSQRLSSSASVGKDHFVLPGYFLLLPISLLIVIIWLIRSLLRRPYAYPKYPNYQPPQR
jgi:hypothetical protein